MENLKLAVLMVGLLVLPLLGQTPQKIAAINKKVVGKWWSGDQKNYIQFLDNGVCSEGTLFPDGKWHVENGKLGAWVKGEDFSCVNGTLTQAGPNVLTRDYGMGGDAERFYRGLQSIPKRPTLTLPLAQKILSQQINSSTGINMLFTCRACYDRDDKEDNDKAPLVTTYSVPLNDFLTNHGYIRTNGRQQYFTAKAKRSKYYEGLGGLRFANFKNPRILITRIVDPKNVPIEYDFVPTELTMGLFGKIQRVKSFVSFSYENEAWSVSLTCRQ